MTWRMIDDGACDPAWNMAVDEAVMQCLANGVSTPLIRFYDWAPPTLSLGYHQEAAKEVDFDRLRERGYGFVRRPTGGRAVLHKHEVTYSVIAPLEGDLHGGVTESYSVISQALALGLQKLGVEAELEKGKADPEWERRKGNPCFSSASRYELTVNGRKIVGSAQVRKEGVLLQHGSILLTDDQSEMADLLPDLTDERREKVRRFLSRKTISISQATGRTVLYGEAVEALKDGFREFMKNILISDEDGISDEETRLARQLQDGRYSGDDWNLKK